MKEDKEKLAKILECIGRIKEYTQQGKNHFFTDRKTQDAVVRNLQIIGDAVKGLSDELRTKNTEIDWSEWAKSRDKITHDYFDVDYEKVWKAIEDDLPHLQERIEEIHQRLVYKVPGEQKGLSKLQRKLTDKDNQL